MTADLLLNFEQSLRGRECKVVRLEHDWQFNFGDDCFITVSTTWRIISSGRIALAMADHGQRFGWPEPIDAEANSNALLKGRHVQGLKVDRVTADLRVQFDDGTLLELITDSSGYEG